MYVKIKKSWKEKIMDLIKFRRNMHLYIFLREYRKIHILTRKNIKDKYLCFQDGSF